MPFVERVLARSPLVRAGARFLAQRPAVLAMHGVPSPDAFARLLDALRQHHSLIGPEHLRAWLAGEELPPNAVLMTFDDGDPTVLDHAAHQLSELGVGAFVFVVAGLLDTDTPFWWDEVAASSADALSEVRRLKSVPDEVRRAALATVRAERGPISIPQLSTAALHQLIDAGFEIGNHSFDHPCLDKCDTAEAINQIERCHDALLARGIDARSFAYPNGNLDARIEPTLRELGYDVGFLFDHRHTRRSQERLRLSRLRLDSDAPPERAALVTSGVHGAIMRLRRRG